MTLQVPLEQFAPTLARHGLAREAYICSQDGTTRVTAAHPTHQIVVVACTRLDVGTTRERLEAAELAVYEGHWRTEGAPELAMNEPETYVAAVAYRSGEDRPGLWIDAYSGPPSQMQVLKRLYDEFRQTGEMGELHFEEFVRLSHPNVVILHPSDLRNFVDKNHALLTSPDLTEDTGTR